MVVCGRWHLQLTLMHYPAVALAMQTPKGTWWGAGGVEGAPTETPLISRHSLENFVA